MAIMKSPRGIGPKARVLEGCVVCDFVVVGRRFVVSGVSGAPERPRRPYAALCQLDRAARTKCTRWRRAKAAERITTPVGRREVGEERCTPLAVR